MQFTIGIHLGNGRDKLSDNHQLYRDNTFFVLFILLGLSLYLQIASLALILLIPFYLGSGGIVGDVPDDAYIQLSLQSCLATVFVMGIFHGVIIIAIS
ncbi:hypothetical protein J4731_06225 [Providencia rettgeri]|uniref:Uncharacterized protein n=1 Tax=Providencia rettgeri TaxID=587 RepID=A0A939SIW5_PRORE|nr:hypothetical protein [Providencia rettgeri]MBO1928944.1 hypothetical protein [Providencia rettgeri]